MWRDETYLLDMLLAARKVLQFAAGYDLESFLADEKVQNAVMRQIQILGEAAWKISSELKEAHAEIPWPGIIGMRHRLVHDYFAILADKVWIVVETDIPAVIPLLEALVPPEEELSAERAPRS